jgi:hypothetical protein
MGAQVRRIAIDDTDLREVAIPTDVSLAVLSPDPGDHPRAAALTGLSVVRVFPSDRGDVFMVAAAAHVDGVDVDQSDLLAVGRARRTCGLPVRW